MSATTVGKYRKKAPSTIQNGKSTKRVGADGARSETANIGKKKAKPATKPEAEKPTASASAPGQVVQDKAEPHDDSVDEHTDEREVQPEVVQSEDAENDAAGDLCSEREMYLFPEDAIGLDPECREAIIDEIEEDVAHVQETVSTILQTEEVAALPEMNHLRVLLKRLEIAADNVASFLASQRVLLEMSVPADIEEDDDKVQDDAGGEDMDGLTLLNKAQSAGLTVEAQGDRLFIKGPRRAEAVAKELIDRKTAVMAALRR